jgi:hypothetical protein
MGIVEFGVTMRPVGAKMRLGGNIKVSLRVGELPPVPGVPRGSWGWAVLETDVTELDSEEVVVGGAAPSAAEAAALGAHALEIELARRRNG